MSDAYRHLREGAALVDLGGRGRIRVTGDDRVRLLHAMTTNHVEQLEPGAGCYAFFLDAQGHILADVNLLSETEALVLDTEPETREIVYEHLDRFIIADDVTLEDLTALAATLAVEGPGARDALARIGAPTPEESLESSAWGDRKVLRASVTGGEGWWVHVPAGEKDAFVAEAGLVQATDADVRTVRLENAHPRYGEDITDSVIPHETQLLHAVHFSKGCYLGQEIVERVRARGHVNRLLVHLRVEGNHAPAAGARLVAEDKDVGYVTSAASSPALGHVVALGYLRAAQANQGTKLGVENLTAEVTGLRPR